MSMAYHAKMTLDELIEELRIVAVDMCRECAASRRLRGTEFEAAFRDIRTLATMMQKRRAAEASE